MRASSHPTTGNSARYPSFSIEGLNMSVEIYDLIDGIVYGSAVERQKTLVGSEAVMLGSGMAELFLAAISSSTKTPSPAKLLLRHSLT